MAWRHESSILIFNKFTLFNKIIRAEDIVDIPASWCRNNDVFHRRFNEERSSRLIGLDCSLQSRDEEEITGAVSQIARLHKALRKIETKDDWNLGSILSEPMTEEMERHNRELRRTRNFISSKRKKSDFELCVMGNFSMFYEQALEACEGLGRMVSETGAPEHYLCHGELNQHHILMGPV